jgi:modulator of drug activity B
MKNALVINAHQVFDGVSSGNLNRSIIKIIIEELKKRDYAIKETNIEAGYDVNEEVNKHAEANLIILQSPVYWFGNPWMYKKYVDEVFSAGLFQQKLMTDDGRSRDNPQKQYGTGGKLIGTKYMLSLTWNAPKEAFGDEEQYLFNGKTVDDLFTFNTANYKSFGAEILPAFSCFNVMKEPQIDNDILRLRKHFSNILD